MKAIAKNLLKLYLKSATKLALVIHKPKIIVVAGSINKPFAKEAVKAAINDLGVSARANPKNFNTEIGLPLSILNLKSGYNSYKKWLPAIWQAPGAIFSRNFPEYLVLSLGTSDPGDMKYLLTLIRPDITIITDITQRYLESFTDMNELVKEYELLARKTRKNGLLILNFDNYRVRNIGKQAKERVITFGFAEGSDCRASGIEKTSEGMKGMISYKGTKGDFRISRFGNHHIQALLVSHIVKDYVAR